MNKDLPVASRASVNTTLKIGLIEAPISLYKATGDNKAQKWERANADGSPVTPLGSASTSPPQVVGSPLAGDEAKTSEPASRPIVTPEGLPPLKPRKGVRKIDGTFVDLTDQIEQIAEESRIERMEVISFIDTRHIPAERVTGAYYLGSPNGRLLAVLAAAMLNARAAAVVRFSKRKGQTLGVLAPSRGGALVLRELVFAEQMRRPSPKCLVSTQIEVTDEEVDQATNLIKAMAGRRQSLDDIKDPRAAAERELAVRATEGELDEYKLLPDEALDSETEQLAELLAASVS